MSFLRDMPPRYLRAYEWIMAKTGSAYVAYYLLLYPGLDKALCDVLLQPEGAEALSTLFEFISGQPAAYSQSWFRVFPDKLRAALVEHFGLDSLDIPL